MIHGITPTLAEGGKIKIGGLGEERTARGSGKKFRLPLKFDHFLVTKTTRDDKGDLALDEAVMKALAKDDDGKVRAIPIALHSDNIDDVFPTTYALYTGRRLTCRGDGQVAIRWQVDSKGARTGESKEMKCPCDYLGAKEGPVCKPHGTLHASIALPGVAVAGAVHKWRTTSIISIQRMIGSLQQIVSLCGTLRGIPLWLKVEPITVTPGTVTTEVYCCHVELRAQDIMALQTKALKMAGMRKALGGGNGGEYRALLAPPAGDQETPEEQAEIEQEFHTDTSDPDVQREVQRDIGEAARETVAEEKAKDEARIVGSMTETQSEEVLAFKDHHGLSDDEMLELIDTTFEAEDIKSSSQLTPKHYVMLKMKFDKMKHGEAEIVKDKGPIHFAAVKPKPKKETKASAKGTGKKTQNLF